MRETSRWYEELQQVTGELTGARRKADDDAR
jgi:hypothetical protein